MNNYDEDVMVNSELRPLLLLALLVVGCWFGIFDWVNK